MQGECRVSRGESKVSRRVGLPRISRSPRSKPKMASLNFWWPFRDSCCVAMVEPPVSYLRVHGPYPLPARWVPYLSLPAARVLLAVSYLFNHPLPPPPLPPHHHRHGQKEDYWSRAGRSCQSEWLPEGCTPRQR